MNSLILSSLCRNTRLLACVAFLFTCLIGNYASSQSYSYTFRNTNNIINKAIPTWNLNGNTFLAQDVTFINYYPSGGVFNISGYIYCSSDMTNFQGTDIPIPYNGKDYRPSICYLDSILTGPAFLYADKGCVAYLRKPNSYTGGTCVDGAALVIDSYTTISGTVISGTLGSTNSRLVITNGGIVNLGGTTQTVQSVEYVPYDEVRAPNGGIIKNGTLIDGDGNTTIYNANGTIVYSSSSGGKISPLTPIPST